jgi:hypothetical protein
MTMTAAAAAAGGRQQPLTAWYRAGVRQPKAAEMDRNGNNVGMINVNFHLVIVLWVYFYSYPTVFPVH